MNNGNREIEVKLASHGHTLFEVSAKLQKLLGGRIKSSIYGDSVDAYWQVHGQTADFIRLRQNGSGGEMTIKAKDKGSNLNRLEINVNVDNLNSAFDLVKAAFGPMAGVIRKQYYVHWVTADTNVSCYWIEGDKPKRVFIEIEGPSENIVRDLVGEVSTMKDLALERQSKSLFEMFILPNISKPL